VLVFVDYFEILRVAQDDFHFSVMLSAAKQLSSLQIDTEFHDARNPCRQKYIGEH
jgi:hypothetical protein